jgi:hypothetical protein
LGKLQRNKGAGYEREVCEVFSAALGITVKRNIGQSRDGGNDINVGPLVVECKRRKTLGTVESWLLQAAAACDTSAHIPIVVGRSDGGRSLVVLDLDHFIELTQERLLEETEEQPKPVDAYFKQRASEIIGQVDL